MKNYYQRQKIEVGVDEVGRGCLAGPVVAAAVVLPKRIPAELKTITDSKAISEKKREIFAEQIKQLAIGYSISFVNPRIIEQINILNASILAMHKALDKLDAEFSFIIVDGNKFHKYKEIEHKCIIKGDAKFYSIAAASIIAKVERDNLMCFLTQKFPHYKWQKNKGYPTKEHRIAIQKYGITKLHRKSFKLL